ncbi:MAG: MBL fold metallo-hydrolase [Austwickia sp.]|nr:MBL fold metallo-hydrolase [Austwickia sp.]MBK8436299.1 MBL fold metallo-hydrolase [Austwickia sp.]MBK9101977.1 MBL fold metallo-hydrolase [Austwickia sp.]
MSPSPWTEIAHNVFLRRHDYLDVNVGLVVGEHQCLVVDTGWDERHGAEVAASVRGVTSLPWQVMLTHAHFDHAYGAAAFLPATVWGTPGCAYWLGHLGDQLQARVIGELRTAGELEVAERVAASRLVPPDRLVPHRESVDLGGRSINLLYGGAGHTDHDLVLAVPDAGVVFWGDLVEIGADPAYEDGFPRDWGNTLSHLLDTVEAGLGRISVPGHGSVVGLDAVEEQCERHRRLAWFLGEGRGAGERNPDDLVRRGLGSGFSEETVRRAVERLLHIEQ